MVVSAAVAGLVTARSASLPSPSPATTAPPPASWPSSPAVSTPSPAASSAAGTSASCGAGSSVASPRPLVDSPAYNSYVTPYVTFTGPFSYVAGGAALRDQGYGTIDLTWSGPLVGAYLVWESMDDGVPPASADLNGVAITGSWVAYASPSPCWSPEYIYTFVADVSSWVVNGANQLTNFASGITNGSNPWSSPQIYPMLEGASLVVVYESGAPVHQITLYAGALTEEGSGITAPLDFGPATSTSAETTYVFADGQLPGNGAIWNGVVIDANAFPGTDPKATPTPWSEGNLSDTRTFAVSVPLGATSVTAGITPSGDCLTWAAQVVSVQVAPAPPPYTVGFTEKGLPTGTTWSVTLDSSTLSTEVSGPNSTVNFTQVANGSYPYSIGAVAGYVAEPSSGTAVVAGGNVSILVPFHEPGYNVTFNESGLPKGSSWSVVFDGVEGSSTQRNLTFPVGGNGTYVFSVTPVPGYATEPPSGSVYVEGASVEIDIVFAEQFQVTFEEKGLPAGSTWGADVYSYVSSTENVTSAATFSLELPNASAGSDLLCPLNFYATYYSPCDLYFGVFGAPETIVVPYLEEFTLTVVERGLPAGAYWYVECEGEIYSAAAFVTAPADGVMSLVNESYTCYFYSYNGDYAAPPPVTVDVAGVGGTLYVVFTAVDFTVVFTETGLPAHVLAKHGWTVVLNGTTEHSTLSSIQFTVPGGTYPVLITGPSGYAASGSGTVSVSGPTSVTVTMTKGKTFALHFAETKLPKGTLWCVEVDGDPLCTTKSSLKYTGLAAGPYAYAILPVAGETATAKVGKTSVPLSGSLAVVKSTKVAVKFTRSN